MALVKVDSIQIEEHLNNDGIKVSSFEWNQHYPSSPSFEFIVEDGFEYEDEDLIEKEEFDELSVEHDQLRKEFEELSVEHEELIIKYNDVNAEYDTLNVAYQKLKAQKSLWTKLHFWK